ncbi:MAG: beta-N-acetylhexosaminidase [Marinifilaceae bacterium]
MKRYAILILLVGAFFSCVRDATTIQSVSIIPKPLTSIEGSGTFKLSKTTPIVLTNATDNMRASYTIFNRWLSRTFGTTLEIIHGPAQQGAINITVEDALAPEEYTLDINRKQINITSGSPKGVSYALQTLRQLLPPSAEQPTSTVVTAYKIPAVTIYDCPRYPYRGVKLNVARHFYPVEELKTYIDIMALYKLDLLHLHLTGNQGWRIEIKKYPKLMTIGSRHPRSYPVSEDYTFKTGEGFYTQEQIKDIVKYAADRYITVIPEIEFPNHALAALASYPELGCQNNYQVATTWDNDDVPFCAGNEQVYEFLHDICNEIMPLFPSRFMVIDNKPFNTEHWQTCRKCQNCMTRENFTDTQQLHNYFKARIKDHINNYGKEVIALNSDCEDTITEQPSVMSINYQPTGGKIFMRDNINHIPNSIGEMIGLNEFADNIHKYSGTESLYNVEPTDGLTERESRYLIGIQGNLWTTANVNDERIQYMTLPGVAALAEIAWVPRGERNYNDFTQRTSAMTERYKALGYNYATIITEKK